MEDATPAISTRPENEPEKDQIQYNRKEGTLFLVDCTPTMFEYDVNENKRFFEMAVQAYSEILSDKLQFAPTCSMGLVFFGLNKWDQDPEIKHVLTVQKISKVTRDMKIGILNLDVEEYAQLTANNVYPLRDALWHATQLFSSTKTKIEQKKVVLITREDNPLADNNKERHRIRDLVIKDFRNMNIELVIIGMKDDWNHKLFYKDLDELADVGGMSGAITKLKEMKRRLLFPSRSTATVPLFMMHGSKLQVMVNIVGIHTVRKYLRKIKVNKQTHEPVQTEVINEDDSEDEGQFNAPEIDLDADLNTSEVMCAQFGGRDVKLTRKEILDMHNNIFEEGIEIVGFKKSAVDPKDLTCPTRFVQCAMLHRRQTPDTIKLFNVLLERCSVKGLMAIGVVSYKKRQISSYLYCMIPCIEKGGFYLFGIPYRGEVRDLAVQFANNTYDVLPENPVSVALLQKVVKKMSVKYDPDMFVNPKLEKQRLLIEEIALDQEITTAPIDSTLIQKDAMMTRIERFKDQLNGILELNNEEIAPKRGRAPRAANDADGEPAQKRATRGRGRGK